MKTLQHGGYQTQTAFDIKPHDYAAAGHTDYVELLEILDPPKGKERFVVNHYSVHYGYHFCETSTLAIAKKAFGVVASGLVDNVQKAWETYGINKIYTTKSTLVEPWFYSKSKQFFGDAEQFTAIKKLTQSVKTVSQGKEYLLFSEKPAFSFETVAGIYGKDSVVWESSRSSSVRSLAMISSYADEWKDPKAVSKWMKFLSTGEQTVIEIELPIWTLIFDLSNEFGMIYLRLAIEEEFKGVKVQQDYWKDRKQIPKGLILVNQYPSVADSMVDVVKFFIS